MISGRRQIPIYKRIQCPFEHVESEACQKTQIHIRFIAGSGQITRAPAIWSLISHAFEVLRDLHRHCHNRRSLASRAWAEAESPNRQSPFQLTDF
jgi:hypothetical protein